MPDTKRPAGEGRLLQLVYYAYVAGSRLALALPEKLVYGLAHAGGGLWWRLSKKRRAVVQRNLSRITDHDEGSEYISELSKESFKSYARYWLETFRLVREDKEFFLSQFKSDTEHHIDEMLARGKGAVIVVGHLGNWDAAGAWVGARGQTLVTVAEVLRPRRMFDFFAEHRAKLGMVIHAAQKGVTDDLVAAVENGDVVAILGDRDLKDTGPVVSFLGHDAHLPAGAASIALRSGVPVLVAGVYSTVHDDGSHGWTADISEPIELPDERGEEAVQKLTERIGEVLGAFIAKHPEEWRVFQPFWIADKPARR
jgi:phosphatidylinositol dimannoside acyltransferase